MLLEKRNNGYWLDDLYNSVFSDYCGLSKCISSPSVNIVDGKTDYTLELALPGKTKNDISIKIDENDNLVISMEKKTENKDDGKNYLRKEFSYTQFERRYSIPEDVKKSDINATMENGVLKVVLPKVTETKKENRIIEIA